MQNLYTVLWQNPWPVYAPNYAYINLMLMLTDILVVIYQYSPMSSKDLSVNHCPWASIIKPLCLSNNFIQTCCVAYNYTKQFSSLNKVLFREIYGIVLTSLICFCQKTPFEALERSTLVISIIYRSKFQDKVYYGNNDFKGGMDFSFQSKKMGKFIRFSSQWDI